MAYEPPRNTRCQGTRPRFLPVRVSCTHTPDKRGNSWGNPRSLLTLHLCRTQHPFPAHGAEPGCHPRPQTGVSFCGCHRGGLSASAAVKSASGAGPGRRPPRRCRPCAAAERAGRGGAAPQPAREAVSAGPAAQPLPLGSAPAAGRRSGAGTPRAAEPPPGWAAQLRRRPVPRRARRERAMSEAESGAAGEGAPPQCRSAAGFPPAHGGKRCGAGGSPVRSRGGGRRQTMSRLWPRGRGRAGPGWRPPARGMPRGQGRLREAAARCGTPARRAAPPLLHVRCPGSRCRTAGGPR